MKTRKANITGFSLIELSIVLLIVSIFASSAVNILGKKNVADKYTDTKRKLERIAEAIKIYRLKYNRIPCPAKFANALNATVFGDSSAFTNNDDQSQDLCSDIAGSSTSTQTNDNVYAGAVPFLTLGLTSDYSFDAWGNRISYVMNGSLADSNGSSSAAFVDASYAYASSNTRTLPSTVPRSLDLLLGDGGSKYIVRRHIKRNELLQASAGVTDCAGNSKNPGSTTSPSFYVYFTDCPAFILISHGPNGFLSYNLDASTFKTTNTFGMLGTSEIENVARGGSGYNFNKTFHNRPYRTDTRATTDTSYFDDIVIHKNLFWLNN